MKAGRADRVYVIIQFLLFAAFLFNFNTLEFRLPSLLVSSGKYISGTGLIIVFISLIQLNRNLSPFPTPRENGKLITVGLYALVRHPIYSGILLIFLGYSIYTESIYKMTITLLLWLLFLLKSRYEEKLLTARYPEYEDYKKRTGRLFPKLW